MIDAIDLVFYIFHSSLNFLFNTAAIVPGVTLGWIFISCVVFGILIRSFLVVPRGISTSAIESGDKDV